MKIEIRQFGPGGVVVHNNRRRQVKIKEVNTSGEWELPITNQRKRFFCKVSKFLSIKKNQMFLAAGTVTVLLATTTTFLFTRDTLENRLYNKYYTPKPDVHEMFFIANSPLDEAKEQYKQGDYKAALMLFDNLTNDNNPLEVERQYYSALALMGMGNYQEAIYRFKATQDSYQRKDVLYMVEWNLALCYLKTNERDKAVASLENIVKNNLYNHKKAKRILRRLE